MKKNYQNSKVNKSRSTSVLLKQKINVALGKGNDLSENKQTSNSKNNSTVRKQRSNSCKSLVNRMDISKDAQKSIHRKLSFFQKSTNNLPHQNTKIQRCTKSNLKSEVKQSFQIQNIKNKLIWFDSFDRKLQIVQKKVETLGSKDQELKLQICMNSSEKIELIIRIEGIHFIKQENKAFILNSIFKCQKFLMKNFKKQKINSGQFKDGVNINFDGFLIFSNQQDFQNETDFLNKPNLNSNKLVSNMLTQQISIGQFVIKQIQKLNEDGLQQFSIISKIIRRSIQQKTKKKNVSILLLKLSNQNKQISKTRRILDTQKLIQKKLICIQKITQKNANPIFKKGFFD